MHYKFVCTICGKVCIECKCPGDKPITGMVCDECKYEMYHADGVTINQEELYRELVLPEGLDDTKTFKKFIDDPFVYCEKLVKLIRYNINKETKEIITSPLICVMLVGSKLTASTNENFVQDCGEFKQDIDSISEEILKFEKLQRFGYFKGITIYRNVYAKTNYLTFK